LAGHPLIAYTISSALQSQVFSAVIVSTDSQLYGDIARHYGAEVPFLRPAEFAGDLSPDIEWVEDSLKRLQDQGRSYDCFSILRPTSPFRLPGSIKRAWRAFLAEDGVDSLRAVEKCKQHPGKMWVVRGNRMVPLLPLTPPEQPWHSTIAGDVLMPFFTKDYEGFDVNSAYDWNLAEHLVDSGQARLPSISQSPYPLEEYAE
jgi:N-acylneuraminate cytidylyltransferase